MKRQFAIFFASLLMAAACDPVTPDPVPDPVKPQTPEFTIDMDEVTAIWPADYEMPTVVTGKFTRKTDDTKLGFSVSDKEALDVQCEVEGDDFTVTIKAVAAMETDATLTLVAKNEAGYTSVGKRLTPAAVSLGHDASHKDLWIPLTGGEIRIALDTFIPSSLLTAEVVGTDKDNFSAEVTEDGYLVVTAAAKGASEEFYAAVWVKDAIKGEISDMMGVWQCKEDPSMPAQE